MGWKNVKERYQIQHIVQITDEGLCIGPPYIHDIIVIDLATGAFIKRYLPDGWGRNAELIRYQAEIDADAAELLRLIQAPDTFAASLPVFTYRGGDIIEEACEQYGWPNVTHVGHIMYENTFFADKATAIIRAKSAAASRVEWVSERVADCEDKLRIAKALLAQDQAEVIKLNTDYPEVQP